MSTLLDSAIAYKELLNIEYKIILGRKGRLTEFYIHFKKENFFHLIGLQNLRDINFPTKNKEEIFDLILNETITYDLISKSCFFNSIHSRRLEPFIDIISILDNNNLVFKYNRGAYSWSNIECKYILENLQYDDPIFIFIDEDNKDKKKMYCRSFFKKDKTDFTERNTNMALLYKEKINKKIGISIVQYDRLNK